MGHRLAECGLEVVQVFSRDAEKARALGAALHCPFTNDLGTVNPDADLYLLAVHDSAIGAVASRLSANQTGSKLFAHTSGATPLAVFHATVERGGVFYPVQTFSVNRATDFSKIPICIDATLERDRQLLLELAQQVGGPVYHLPDDKRTVLHIAAVFVNNFANHLFHIGHEILEKENLPFDLLIPLIRETAAKLETAPPSTMQTGPAVRGDTATLHRHLAYLEKYPHYQMLYRLLTQSIDPNILTNS